MTDLEVVDEYIEKCRRFVNPKLLGEVNRRELYNIINYLPYGTLEEQKATAYARLAKAGKVFGDSEIDQISGMITRSEFLMEKLSKIKMTEPGDTIPILKELIETQNQIQSYFTRR